MPRDVHGEKRGRNEPCWCGSGRKYKYCHYERAGEQPTTRTEALQGLTAAFGQKECLCPVDWKDQCTGNIVRAHSLSRRSALAAVTEAGHVFSLAPDMGQLFHKDKFVFRRKSAREASTFTGFCGYHDDKIFLELDDSEFDGSERLTFLSAYRTLCREMFVKKAQMGVADFGKSMDKGRALDLQLTIQEAVSGMFNGAHAALRELEGLKDHFDSALRTSSYGAFAFLNVHYPQQADIVSAGGFNPSHSMSGRFLQNLDLTTYSQNVFYSILPGEGGFWASFLWLRAHSLMGEFVADVERNFFSAGGVYAVALAHIENTFMRPSFWEALPEPQKEALSFLAFMDVLHRDYTRAKDIASELVSLFPATTDRIVRG